MKMEYMPCCGWWRYRLNSDDKECSNSVIVFQANELHFIKMPKRLVQVGVQRLSILSYAAFREMVNYFLFLVPLLFFIYLLPCRAWCIPFLSFE